MDHQEKAKLDLCQTLLSLLREQQELSGRLRADICIVKCTKTMLTAIHKSGKKSNEFSLHTLGSGKKLDMSVCFPIYFQTDEQRVKELRASYFKKKWEYFTSTYLIVMRGTNKYDWALSRNMESTARSYFSKKYLGYNSPEKHGKIVGVRLFKPISWTRHGQNTSRKLSLGAV